VQFAGRNIQDSQAKLSVIRSKKPTEILPIQRQVPRRSLKNQIEFIMPQFIINPDPNIIPIPVDPRPPRLALKDLECIKVLGLLLISCNPFLVSHLSSQVKAKARFY
jgi:hypothetical protein